MSNDVDALMFGSGLTVMNFSKETGSSTSAATHITCYRMCDYLGDPSNVTLDQAGMILFAMLSGGDYLPSGVPKCGSKLAAEIAKAGFGADLLDAIQSDGPELDIKLEEWRERLQYELEQNESGYFQTKHKAVRIPEAFPDRTILSYYANPVVSSSAEIAALRHRLATAWDQEIDALELRRFTADTFEWNYRSGARKVIRLLAEPLVSYRLRLQRHPAAFPQNPPFSDNVGQMLQKVYKSRTSFSTDGLTELQLDIVPIDVVGLDLLAEEPNPPMPSQETILVSGDEEEDVEVVTEAVAQSPIKKRTSKRFDPFSVEKVWIFETLASLGIPEVVQSWKKEQMEKAAAPKKTSNRRTGPRKKGPIDPGMKRGSILKYGTLTKQKSDISEYKGAQLFDAAISATPTKTSVSRSQPVEWSPDASMMGSPAYGGYSQHHVLGLQPRMYQDVDDLIKSFTSSCSISPELNSKRHAMAIRSRGGYQRATVVPGDVEVQTLAASDPESEMEYSPSRLFSGRIRMTYSNVSYNDPIELGRSPRVALSVPESVAKYDASRHKTRKAAQTSSKSQAEISQDVSELQHAMSTIVLDDGSPCKASRNRDFLTHPRALPRRTPRLPEDDIPDSKIQVKRSLRSQKDVSLAVKQSCEKVEQRLSQHSPPAPSLLKPSVKKVSKPEAKLKEQIHPNKGTDSHKNASHVDFVVVRDDGTWTTEAEPQSELASEKLEIDQDTTNEKRKKKRIPRVSILDLS
ncbi:crossover junction endodeoxyribonuclease [Aspergillus clavatus NRRL 1]|uniref:Rad2-like endonuclease, putative n=1 Tax=Aspergillus clavatus (strain ATCC 1007 / CBS 513.65 / DSM 816 / NCTC 3887 / NRRL 1 / QM 1276 / 107) TaxID=344612 RepID=A1CL57_ASPCL|nr:Rad2-like endonuclease, putative [Aspergillus clavatus NRRL 1]EAW09881.1 Rad2-like endonuclease, putative [Aspergillus clavatus NRRL 1]